MRVLTGPAAAAQLGLDGFRGTAWPAMWCSPTSCRPAPRLIRTRHWDEPLLVGELLIANPVLILRHLGCALTEIETPVDGLSPRDRVELAVEHALRMGLVTLKQLHTRSSRSRGDQLLHEVLRLRGNEPPTESYAETRAIQTLRGWDIRCWRQVCIFEAGRAKHRVDLVIPFRQSAKRPELLTPDLGLLLEIDSREFHDGRFEEDHQRQSTYDVLGFWWTTFTPTQLEHHSSRSKVALESKLERCRRNTQLEKSNTQSTKRAGKGP
jgi:hypothetical protein